MSTERSYILCVSMYDLLVGTRRQSVKDVMFLWESQKGVSCFMNEKLHGTEHSLHSYFCALKNATCWFLSFYRKIYKIWQKTAITLIVCILSWRKTCRKTISLKRSKHWIQNSLSTFGIVISLCLFKWVHLLT